MKGFDAEFRDLDHYIRVITDRIWEGRRLDDIERYYGADCAIETPSSVSIGIAPVIEGTRATLAQFPDRRLLAEDVIVSGDDESGLLSSHRISSSMAHVGPSAFGAPTGRPVHVRTIADCICRDNRIVHEWLVRDQAAIARQIGIGERELAGRWLADCGGWLKPAPPPAPAYYRSTIEDSPVAAGYAQAYRRAWAGDHGAFRRTHADDAIVWTPGGTVQVGAGRLAAFWHERATPFARGELAIEHLVANDRPGRATAIAMRWRLRAAHSGAGAFGDAAGRTIELLGISHAEVQGGRVVREWILIDDVAVWMQILAQ